MTGEFTIARYDEAIKSYLSSDYQFQGLDQTSAEKNIVLIHDVDHNIQLCDNLLSVEKQNKVKASYFLRLHARSYNMLSRNSLSIADKILNAGCELGLHYEPSYCPPELEYCEHISQEMNILSSAIGIQINHFNLHEPSRTGVKLFDLMPSKNRCYNSPHYKEYKYLSDSSCRWREGCFSQHVEKWNNLLVLTHPLWWYVKCPTENY